MLAVTSRQPAACCTTHTVLSHCAFSQSHADAMSDERENVCSQRPLPPSVHFALAPLTQVRAALRFASPSADHFRFGLTPNLNVLPLLSLHIAVITCIICVPNAMSIT